MLPLLFLLAVTLQASDEFTLYELLAPDTHAFAITYDTAATKPGMRYLYNPIRQGAAVSHISVIHRATGRDLVWKLLSGKEARTSPDGPPDATDDSQYLQITLPTPVPPNGEIRVRILKTYRDSRSYDRRGDTIVFDRIFTIKRNAILLPPAFSLESASAPTITSTQPDGRIRISFLHDRDDAVRLRLVASRIVLPPSGRPQITGGLVLPNTTLPTEPPTHRAADDKEITYLLNDPASNSFRISHEFTVERPNQKHVHNFVRKGSKASAAQFLNLDTGLALKTYEVTGKQVNSLGYYPEHSADDAVVLQADLEKPIGAGESVRIRVTETYTDPASYKVHENELSWDRSLSRPRNTVVLPKGWTPTLVRPPAALTVDGGGRIALRFFNPRTDDTNVSLRARKLP